MPTTEERIKRVRSMVLAGNPLAHRLLEVAKDFSMGDDQEIASGLLQAFVAYSLDSPHRTLDSTLKAVEALWQFIEDNREAG